MKIKLLLYVLFSSISLQIFSQVAPDGAMGAKYGQSRPEVISLMQSRGGILDKTSDQQYVMFSGLKYGKYSTVSVIFTFSENKLSAIGIFLKPGHQADVLDLYNDVCTLLKDKYGNPHSNIEEYKYPYEKDDGHYETAITLGKAKIMTIWSFNADSSDRLGVLVRDNFEILITYTNGLYDSQRSKEKEKQSKDY